MIQDSKSAKFVRGLVKAVFIGCYAAFMWASIHHVAVYFDNFEQYGASDMVGSYLLAGAFDVTALVVTIGVMFFRKSMPRQVQVIVWVFIVAIAGYSFFVNWEYAAHFQSMDLVLQPTGATMPVYDLAGHLHYVPVMRANIGLLVLNPLLASGFTIFSLIYSIVAEFFGSKPPTAEELVARKKYLEDTAGVVEEIRKLEAKNKGKGLIAALKEKAIEGKSAWQEITKSGEETEGQTEQIASEAETGPDEGNTEENAGKVQGKERVSSAKPEWHFELSDEANIVALHYENARSWLMAMETTVDLKTVAETMNLSMKMLHNRVASRRIRATKNKAIVYKDSVVSWAMGELMSRESAKIVQLRAVRNEEESSVENDGQAQDDKLAMALEALGNNPDITDEMLAEILGLRRAASARFWRLKATELLSRDRETVNA